MSAARNLHPVPMQRTVVVLNAHVCAQGKEHAWTRTNCCQAKHQGLLPCRPMEAGRSSCEIDSLVSASPTPISPGQLLLSFNC